MGSALARTEDLEMSTRGKGRADYVRMRLRHPRMLRRNPKLGATCARCGSVRHKCEFVRSGKPTPNCWTCRSDLARAEARMRREMTGDVELERNLRAMRIAHNAIRDARAMGEPTATMERVAAKIRERLGVGVPHDLRIGRSRSIVSRGDSAGDSFATR